MTKNLKKSVRIILSLAIFINLGVSANKNNQKYNPAESLSKEMFTKEQYEDLMHAVIQNGVGMAAQNLEAEGGRPDIQNNFSKVEKLLRDKFTYNYFIKLNTESMQKEFKPKEIQEILKFYKTKLGQKWLENSQKVVVEAMDTAQTDLQVLIPKMSDSLKLAEAKASESNNKAQAKK